MTTISLKSKTTNDVYLVDTIPGFLPNDPSLVTVLNSRTMISYAASIVSLPCTSNSDKFLNNLLKYNAIISEQSNSITIRTSNHTFIFSQIRSPSPSAPLNCVELDLSSCNNPIEEFTNLSVNSVVT